MTSNEGLTCQEVLQGMIECRSHCFMAGDIVKQDLRLTVPRGGSRHDLHVRHIPIGKRRC